MLLSARMQVDYRKEYGVRYYIVITISDFERGAFWFDKSIRIDKGDSAELYNAFVTYCRDKVNNILFPV